MSATICGWRQVLTESLGRWSRRLSGRENRGRFKRHSSLLEPLAENQPFKKICGLFGISRTTGYEWVSRYQEVGNLRELKERSRRPHQVPNKTRPDIEGNVLASKASTRIAPLAMNMW